jgi:hypothetical protein
MEQAMPTEDLTRGADIDSLIALVEHGPLWDGDVPSKSGRDALIDKGLAVRVLVNGCDGYTAATYAGRNAYMQRYGTSLGGTVDTVAEAMANRKAGCAINQAKREAV